MDTQQMVVEILASNLKKALGDDYIFEIIPLDITKVIETLIETLPTIIQVF